MTSGVMRVEASRPEGWYDLIHSHYWLSGQVGWLASERWRIPLVHSMHTMAKVKNLELAEGDTPEPNIRIIGEQQVVDAASRLTANTDDEARQLIELYGADPNGVDVVHPGVDLDVFSPHPTARDRGSVRVEAGIGHEEFVLLFVGRIQPLKAPDLLIRALASLRTDRPDLPVRAVVCGRPVQVWTDRRRWRTSRAISAFSTKSLSSRRRLGSTWRICSVPLTSRLCPRIRNRSGSLRWNPRRVELPSWLPRSVGYALRSPTRSVAFWWTVTIQTTTPG